MMTNELTLFDFNGTDIRVIEIDGNAWFPAKDVCDLLGIANPRRAALDLCDGEDVTSVLKSNVRSTDVSFPNRGMTCVNETGLYDLIGASRKPAARAFRKWVNGTVLPAIRKDGGYVRGEENVETEEDVFALAQRTVEMLQKKLKEKTEQLDIVSERVADVQRTLHHVARQMDGVNSMAVKRDLKRAGILYHRGGQYRVYSKHQNMFTERLVQTKGGAQCEIVVTPAGQQKLAEMKANGDLTMLKGHRPH